MQPAVFYGPGQQGSFVPANAGGRGGMQFAGQAGMVMPGMPGGRPGQFAGGFPGQQGGRGGMNPNQQLPPNFIGGQGLPMGAIQGAGGIPNGLNYPIAQVQPQQFGRGSGGRGQAPGMQGMPPNVGNVPNMRGGPGGQGYGQGRNAPMQQGMGRPGQGGRGQAVPGMPGQGMPPRDEAASSGALTLQTINAAPPAQQKQMLGEAIYPKIHAQQPELAGKITGMLLEMDNAELFGL